MQVLQSLEKLRNILTQPCNIRVHMAAHVEKLVRHCGSVNPADVWVKEFLPPGLDFSGERFVTCYVWDHFWLVVEVLSAKMLSCWFVLVTLTLHRAVASYTVFLCVVRDTNTNPVIRWRPKLDISVLKLSWVPIILFNLSPFNEAANVAVM